MNVGELVREAARQYGDRTAIVCEDRRLTFAEVAERSGRLAAGLERLGLRKGDRVAVLTHNSAEYPVVEFGLATGGYVAVPLNARLTADDLARTITDAGASALIFQDELRPGVELLRSRLSLLAWIGFGDGIPTWATAYEDVLTTGIGHGAPPEIDASDLHTIMYTSGTTGEPKGAMHTHATRVAVTANLLLEMPPDTANDRLLHVAPLTHGSGMFVLPYFVRGACSVILPRFDAEHALETMVRHEITCVKLVPTILRHLLAAPSIERLRFPALRSIIYGASPMPLEWLLEAHGRFGDVFTQLYGQVEAPMTITVLRREDHQRAMAQADASEILRSAGRPWWTVQVRVVDAEGQDVKEGEVGEVLVRGPHVMRGYWNLPEATADTLRAGWVHTRDLARFDERRYLYLVDRTSDMVITGGFNVYPREVEDVLLAHGGVAEVAVVGVPDEVWGESVRAFVVAREGVSVSAEDLDQHCRARMAGFKRPRSYEFIGEIPRNAYGKPLRRALRARFMTDSSPLRTKASSIANTE
jgi:acyl-CoA synthetase (AMP-forming)/AMP-acid ligase II